MNEIERAERIQAWKAFLIPSTLFVACLLNAAGIYILYTGNTLGLVFLGMGFTVIVGGLFAFITFQNTKRAKGQWKRLPAQPQEEEAVDQVEEQENSALEPSNVR
jgi:hypothetical protein